MARPGVAGGIRDHERRHPLRGPAHHLLGEIAAQAQTHQHHPPSGQRVEQGEHIPHCGFEVEAAGGLPVRPQVGNHQPEAVLQGLDLRGPRPVIQRGAVQQDHGRAADGTAGPVPHGRVGPHQIVRVQKAHLFLSEALPGLTRRCRSCPSSGERTRPSPTV